MMESLSLADTVLLLAIDAIEPNGIMTRKLLTPIVISTNIFIAPAQHLVD